MPYAEIAPASELRSLVECYWTISGPSAAHRVLPDGCIDVLLGGSSRGIVVGTMTRAIVSPASSEGVIGIRFRAGEAARLLPAAPRELTDGVAPLDDLWDSASELEDTLLGVLERSSTEPLAAAPSIDELLSRRIARSGGAVDLRIRAALAFLADGGTVHEAARAACLSERQLTRRFEARVGIAPKMFGRVTRLQRAVAAISAGERASVAAAVAGYADQAHFTRDASALAGVTPRVLVAERRPPPVVSDSFKTAGAAST
ncbi:MAG: hypothetical protein BGO98_28375 [Myxococcales bacterium 68-20]|nr:AraC family transcriptional regulator [Myxococcales bacterium]OJY30623.1 MAG: hypothetical protein BGO98_28375 [Myxococcales bacterium 68-20]